jgi:hypothetical protein
MAARYRRGRGERSSEPKYRARIAGLELEVEPLEAIDGTPVVDIKPVLRGER